MRKAVGEVSPWTPRACLALVMVLTPACGGAVGDSMGASGGPRGGSGGRGSADRGDAVGGAGGEGASAAVPPPAALTRRLTREQYACTVEDVLGVRLSDMQLAKLPAEPLLDGFSGLSANLTVFEAHAQGYLELAESIAAGIGRFDAFAKTYATCTEAKPGCQESYVKGLGRRLFRRPLDARERGVFVGLFQKVNDLGGDFLTGARAVLEAMLQAPQFLYRLERETGEESNDGQRIVGGFEMASRLSYLMWSSAPDETLLAAAEAGELDGLAGIEDQAARLLGDATKAMRSSARFVRDTLKLETLADPGTQREGLTESLRQELTESAVAFYQDHLWKEARPLAELFVSRKLFLSPTMAAWYGLEPTSSRIAEYTSDEAGAIGWLTQPGAMAGTADRDVGGMVMRGLFMEHNIFCGEPTPPPPADIDLEGNKVHLGKASERAYSEDRLARTSCKGCHARFEPLAYGFERFNGLGRYVMRDGEGNDLREDGWIPASQLDAEDDVPYANVEAYMSLLAKSPRVQRCLTRRHIEYALGEILDASHEKLVDDVHERFAGGTYLDMMRAIVAQPSFRTLSTP